jgi:hypothetical protein
VQLFSYLEKCYDEIERHVNEGCGDGQLDPYGAPLGNLERVRLLRLFERQMKKGSGKGASINNLIWDNFLDPNYIRRLSLGAKKNFCKWPGLL